MAAGELTNEQIEAKVLSILGEYVGDDVSMEDNLMTELGADSMDMKQITIEIENCFDFEVDDADFEELKTVGDLVAYVQKRVG